MGIWNSLTKASSRSEATTTYDGHSISTPSVLNGASDGLTAASQVEWTVATPESIKKPTTATIEEAEKEELEAVNYKNAVTNGLRVVAARTQKFKDTMRLTVGVRKHQGVVADVTVGIAAANQRLATKLQNTRAAFARLGHSLDDTTQRIDHQVEITKAKYQQRGR